MLRVRRWAAIHSLFHVVMTDNVVMINHAELHANTQAGGEHG